MKRNHISLTGPDKYGHWWFEIGDPLDLDSESYGWWPAQPIAGGAISQLVQTMARVPGALNGEPGFWAPHGDGDATHDPHHGHTPEESFHPLVKNSDTRSDDEIADCLRAFARRFAASCNVWRWRFGIGPNCHTFQEDAMRHCGLWQPGRTP